MTTQREKQPNDPHGNSDIAVTVNYQDLSKTHSFRRGAKIADVLTWAIEAFSIDDAIATEIELALQGSKEELPGSKPLASLVHGDSVLILDLIRGDIANGNWQ